MTSIPLRNAWIVTPTGVTPGELLAEDGVISQVRFDCSTGAPADRIIDAGRRYFSPGFIDIHTYDAGGVDFMDGTLDVIYQACRKYMEHGITSIVSTTITSTKESLLSFIDLFNQARPDREDIPNILGLHLEGFYFAYEQRGAQDPKYLCNPNPEEYSGVLRRADRIIRQLFTVELNGADLFLRTLWEHNIISSLAHSGATCPQVLRVYENGISALTHFYSAMPGVCCINAYRVVGAIEAGYLLDDLFVGVIVDGKHLPAELLQLIYKIKGPERICPVADSIRAAGTPDGSYILGNRETGMETIVGGGVAKLPDRSAFAGSVATTDCLVCTILQMTTAPLHEAIKMMTLTPAWLLRIDDCKGSTSEGKDADLLLSDENVNVEMVLVRGRIPKEN